MRIWSLLASPFRRARRVPLAQRRPARAVRDVPLGMEALDLDAVAAVNRRNNALERVSGGDIGRGARGHWSAPGQTARPALDLPDDETYAARYHRAFQHKDDTT